MSKKPRTAITPTREEDYPQWYQEVIKASDLAENSVARGCMVIKPWGYALWENMKAALDQKIKDTGHENYYFPMFVPLSFLSKEAEHVDGFAKECAVVTHHRLEADPEQGGLVPAGKLEEPYIIRPTSEAVIGEAYSRWINSYRDLPVLGNQWANVVRWEMRPRIFLRTSEFLWQEGHTAHATREEAEVEADKMLEVYREFVEDYLALPVILGEKTENEKFPGADVTLCIEAMMQDKKALQAGTSHFLGQNFAKAFNIKYLSADGVEKFVWTTSWGSSTRLIGGLIMIHSDDDGLVLPPMVAPTHIVIVPLLHKSEQADEIIAFCDELEAQLSAQQFDGKPIRVHIDKQDKRPGDKVWSWIKKGVPVRLEVGQKELDNKAVFMGRRDSTPKDKQSVPAQEFVSGASDLLSEIQNNLLARAKQFQEDNSVRVSSKDEFYKYFTNEEDSGFAYAYWAGDDATEKALKQDLKVTARCVPLATKSETGTCIFTGQENAPLTVFARAY